MRIDVITLFPDFIESCARIGVVGRARERGLWTLGVWNPRDRDVSVAFRRLDAHRAAVVMVRTPDGAPRDFVLSAGVFALVVVLWGPLCALLLGHAVSAPIERLARAAREIVEEGKQSEMDALPVARADEIGGLTDRFNDLIEMMRDLSVAADAIAKGDLRVSIQGKGELPDAFRGMLASLRAMVHQIGETSVELGSAATEIFAASQEQEAAGPESVFAFVPPAPACCRLRAVPLSRRDEDTARDIPLRTSPRPYTTVGYRSA